MSGLLASLDLTAIWAGLLAFIVLTYVVLDGFDLGVGILFLAERGKEDRDVMVNTIAPVWDGNETWLILGGGGLLAVFPLAYATILPALYPAIIGLLLGVVVGVFLQPTVPPVLQPYLPIAIVAALDALFGGFRAVIEGIFNDRVFVISLIFTYFAVPRVYQHRVLFWGIFGVIVLRAIMIGLGAALVTQFSWVLYLFGAFLLVTGVKMLLVADHMPKLDDNPVLRFMRRRMKVTNELHGERFFVRLPAADTGRTSLYATPLFLALVLIEVADLVFAVDSVPAIFAITTDPYIVYTSNIFAILGLRALYFALAAMVHRFAYLKYALSLVLIFIGAKIFWNQLFGKLDPSISLGVSPHSTSSSRTRQRALAVPRMYASSSASTKKVLRPPARSSFAPMRV